MGTIRTPMRLAGAYADPAKIESLLGGTKFALKRNTTVFADPFSDNSFDATKWNRTQVGSGTVLEQNNRLEVKGSGSWHQAAVVSVNTYTGTGDVLIEIKIQLPGTNNYVMFGLSTSATPSYTGAFIYFTASGTFQPWYAGASYPSLPMPYVGGVAYTVRMRRNPAYASWLQLTIQGGIYVNETVVGNMPWTWTTPFYFHWQEAQSGITAYFTDFAFYDNGGWDATSPPVYTVFDNSIVGATSDMSTFSNRGDNVNGETGSVKYKYFFSDTLYDPTVPADLVTIIAGLNASWLTEAQMQAVADPSFRYRYLAEQLISDGTQQCSQVECSDLLDVVLPAAAGGGGAWVF